MLMKHATSVYTYIYIFIWNVTSFWYDKQNKQNTNAFKPRFLLYIKPIIFFYSELFDEIWQKMSVNIEK